MATVNIFDMADTWNDGGTTFTAIKMNVTDTASAAASALLDLLVGGSSKFTVAKTGKVTISGGTVTASTPLLDMSQTWNDGAVTFTALKLNITNTASADSYFAQLQVGGSDVIRVGRAGYIRVLSAGSTSAPAFWCSSGGTSTGIMEYAGDLALVGSGAFLAWFSSGEFGFGNNPVGFGSAARNSVASDTFIRRAGVAKITSFEGSSSTGGTVRFIATTPAQVTANQNDYAPGGTSLFQRWSTDASRNITGLSLSQVDGQIHVVINVGSNNMVLQHQNASSTAANRFLNSTGADITLSATQAADLIYDGTQSRWLVFKRN